MSFAGIDIWKTASGKFLAITLAVLGLAGSSLAQIKHVFVVMEENHSYSSVIGSSSMPYLNTLAKKYSLATNYYANTHPSIGNYFMLTTGRTVTNNDAFNGTVSGYNVVQTLLSHGLTWKSYAESLPAVGYIGGNSGAYLKHHNPFAYFADVVNSSSERQNLVPFTHFASDLTNGRLPSYSFIVPNEYHDAHSGSLSAANSWLSAHIGPLVSNPVMQHSLLVILFDESSVGDTAHGGGHVAMVVIGPTVNAGSKITTFMQHQNTLAMLLHALGI
jgi:phosphatidylinositol-3-phosphatase